MAESSQHENLTRQTIAFIKKRYGSSYSLSIFDDLAKPLGAERPPKIEGYRPDVYAYDTPRTLTIIGESKTVADLETDHTRLQLRAFYDHIVLQNRGLLVISVQLRGFAPAQRVLRSIRGSYLEEHQFADVIIIDEFREVQL